MGASPDVVEFAGADVSLCLVSFGQEIIEQYFVKDKLGTQHLVLVTPTFPGLAFTTPKPGAITAFQASGDSLFPAAPTLGFTSFTTSSEEKGTVVTLSRKDRSGEFVKTICIPRSGRQIEVELAANLSSEIKEISSLLLSYAFLPDGRGIVQGGLPDSTFLPGLRPAKDNVVGDHEFRAPAAIAQKGSLAAILIPNLDVLRENRPMETIVDLDCRNNVVDAPLMSYGFAAHVVRGHVYYATDLERPRPVPKTLHLAMMLIPCADLEPNTAHIEASKYSWEHYGARYFDRVLPQALSFKEYAKYCYPAAFAETFKDIQLGWFEHEISGHICGGMPAGWGFGRGNLSWQCWFNNLRSAYGIRKWGERLNNADWVQKADKMLNLALAAPLDRGACPTTYGSHAREWIGSLLKPTNSVGEPYYDLANMAWKGIWLLRWANDFHDCPRRDEILSQCREMAECMMRYQNADGSFPAWLTKEHEVIPVLNGTAESALPTWFLFKLSEMEDDAQGQNDRLSGCALRAADFLLKSVVAGNYYYDFETFFSCSPKEYKVHHDGAPDHEAMRDLHSLQPPQNTLSMQWTAEALRAAHRLTKQPNYLNGALSAIEIMSLYQAVWPVSYRHTAYTYGGFGVQNSDGEYNDARQAQFGETLCDFGSEFGRQDLFERGVAAVRASMALINHPLHDALGIYPNPNYPPGLEPENCCHEGEDTQAGRTGFDWGEGSGLASMAMLLDKFGGAFTHKDGKWTVGVDGIAVTPPSSR